MCNWNAEHAEGFLFEARKTDLHLNVEHYCSYQALEEREKELEESKKDAIQSSAPAHLDYQFAENVGNSNAPPLPPRSFETGQHNGSDPDDGASKGPALPPRSTISSRPNLDSGENTRKPAVAPKTKLVRMASTGAARHLPPTVPPKMPPPSLPARKASLLRKSTDPSLLSALPITKGEAKEKSQDYSSFYVRSTSCDSNSSPSPTMSNNTKRSIRSSDSDGAAWDSIDFLVSSKTAVPNAYHRSLKEKAPNRLYPSLPTPDEASDALPAIPSAPELTQTMVRQQAAFLQEQVQAALPADRTSSPIGSANYASAADQSVGASFSRIVIFSARSRVRHGKKGR